MLVNRYRLPGQRMPPAALLDLPPAILNRHRVVLAHYPFRLNGEDPIQIAAATPAKRRALFGSRDRELTVELIDIVFPQEAIGLLHRGDPSQPEFLRQP